VPSIWDHLVVLSFTVALPLYAAFKYPRFQRALASGTPGARPRQYRNTALRQWLLAFAALAVWFGADRPPEALGLGMPSGSRFWVALAAATALALTWHVLFRAAVNDEEGREHLIEQLRSVEPLLPSTRHELRLFTVLSLTAGFCEELLFRGYLIWYLALYVGVPAAGVLSGILFGLGHLYQGPPQAAKIILLGLLFAALYLVSGSLWIPIVLHAALDAAQGRVAYRLLFSEKAPSRPRNV